jgi:hypothetical protein
LAADNLQIVPGIGRVVAGKPVAAVAGKPVAEHLDPATDKDSADNSLVVVADNTGASADRNPVPRPLASLFIASSSWKMLAAVEQFQPVVASCPPGFDKPVVGLEGPHRVENPEQVDTPKDCSTY